MKLVIVTLFAIMTMAPFSGAAANPSDIQSIETIILEIRDGWLNADRTPFDKHFLDFEGARYVESGGQNDGLTDLIEHHVVPEGNHLKDFDLKFENIEVHLEEGFAWAVADVSVYAVIKSDGRIIDKKGYETFLLRQVEGSWKVVHTHSSTRSRKK
jgi:calcium/calmodulin dependent protein kinase II association protein